MWNFSSRESLKHFLSPDAAEVPGLHFKPHQIPAEQTPPRTRPPSSHPRAMYI